MIKKWEERTTARRNKPHIMRHMQAEIGELRVALNSIAIKNAPEIAKCNAYIDALTEERDALRAELDRLKQQEPVGFVVLWGIGEKQTTDHLHKYQEDAESYALCIKSETEVKPVYLAAGAQPAEIEALRADAERPEPCQECGSSHCNGECSGDGAMGG